jgi:serine/threonine-protein kinase
MSLLGAVLWTVSAATDHLVLDAVTDGEVPWNRLDLTDAISVAGILVSLGLYLFTRRTKRDPAQVLDIGLGYMIFVAFAVSTMLHFEPEQSGWTVRPMLSWGGVVVIMFAAIVPNTPRKTLIASLIAVSMNPVSMLLSRARGDWDFGPPSHALLMHYPDLLLVGVAVVISMVVTRLGEQVSRARELGSYQLGELLGRGGMGEVYKATHRMLARPAAIKLIRPEAVRDGQGEGSRLAVRRFRREAEAAANLRSPHTVQLYDFGVTEEETFYFVMELLDGLDLERLVRTHGPMPPARVIHVLRQVCDSLEEAHVSGLVHRDIKPANIHIGRVGLRHDFVKVLDFGLVKAVGADESLDTVSTATGLTPGTPAYMAPEMSLGEQVDARADIYAVGCVAYFLLTGKLVFEADTLVQMIAKHMQAEPVPPSKRAGVDLPRGMDEVVLACLAKRPADRVGSAAELSRWLEAIELAPWDERQAKAWWSQDRAAPAINPGAPTRSSLAMAP